MWFRLEPSLISVLKRWLSTQTIPLRSNTATARIRCSR